MLLIGLHIYLLSKELLTELIRQPVLCVTFSFTVTVWLLWSSLLLLKPLFFCLVLINSVLLSTWLIVAPDRRSVRSYSAWLRVAPAVPLRRYHIEFLATLLLCGGFIGTTPWPAADDQSFANGGPEGVVGWEIMQRVQELLISLQGDYSDALFFSW